MTLSREKRILYIGAPFFNYYQKIVAEFAKHGYVVDYYNDRPSDNSFIKGLIKLKKNLVSIMISRYFNQIIKETKDKEYELVFVVNCKSFNHEMIQKLKTTQPKAKFVLYMWDSFKLYPSSKRLVSSFDQVFSFDSDDCKLDARVKFLPLFYSEEFEKIGLDRQKNFKYDIVSVCTAHPNRYQIIKKIFPFLEEKGIRIYSYLFLNKLQFLYNKIFVQTFKDARSGEFQFSPLSSEENLLLIKDSVAVFDIQHNQQSGLTMRTIETLGAKRKLITYNQDICNYDFYTKENILILTETNWDDISSFLKKEYIDIDEIIYQKYSLKSWVNTILKFNKK